MKFNKRPIHPGEVLREEFLVPLNISANALALTIGVSANRITEIVAEKRSVSAETAILLGKALNTSPEFWMNLQKSYELIEGAKHLDAKRLAAIRPIAKTA